MHIDGDPQNTGLWVVVERLHSLLIVERQEQVECALQSVTQVVVEVTDGRTHLRYRVRSLASKTMNVQEIATGCGRSGCRDADRCHSGRRQRRLKNRAWPLP